MATTARFLDRLLDDGVAAGVAPGMVGALAGPDATFYAYASGLRAIDPPRPMAVDSVFRIASMTKLVTSLGVMMLVEEGRVDLDAPFADYLPGFRQPEVLESFDRATRRYTTRPAGRGITVRELLTHTSGYGYWFLDAPLLGLTDGAPELLNPPFLMHPPGTRFAYGTSTDVLGQIFAPVTGLAVELFFERRIFGPLGMTDTGYEPPEDAARLVTVNARASAGFVEQGNERSGGTQRGGGGLYSTAPDYLRLLRLFLNGGELDGRRLLSADLVAAMTRNQIGTLNAERQTAALATRSNDFIFLDGSQKFGFGVMIETRDRPGRRAAGSYGWGGIYNTYFWVDPQAALAGVLMMQTTPFADPTSIDFFDRFEHAAYALGASRRNL